MDPSPVDKSNNFCHIYCSIEYALSIHSTSQRTQRHILIISLTENLFKLSNVICEHPLGYYNCNYKYIDYMLKLMAKNNYNTN